MAERPESKLPRDPAYWDRLARRIGDDARQPLATYGAAQDAWYDVLARRAAWLVAAAAAAMVILWLALPDQESVAYRWIERAVAPDEIAGTLISSSAPPSVDALMVQFPPAPDEEEQG